MSNNNESKKKSQSSCKRKRKIILPHQPETSSTEEEEEEDIELDHTPKKGKLEATFTNEKEQFEIANDHTEKKEENVDSDDDLLNDDYFANFCNASIVEKNGLDLEFFIDFEYERRMIEQDRKDFQETMRVKKINEDLNRLIEQQVNSSKTVDLKSLTNEEREEHLNVLMDGDTSKLDLSVFEQNYEETYEKYYQDLRMDLFCEEMSRFNVFNFKECVVKHFIHGEESFLDQFTKLFPKATHQFCLKRKNLILNHVQYTVRKVEYGDILEDIGLACMQPKKVVNQHFLSVEEASIVLQLIDKNKCKRLQHLIRQTVRDFVNGCDIDISEQDLACLVVHFLICQEFNYGNYPGKLHNNFVNPQSVYSTLSKTKLISTNELGFILDCLEGNYSTVVQDLFTLFGFSQTEHSTLKQNLTLNSLNSIIRDFFPPTFSKFIMCKPFYNTKKTIITFYKKFFLCLLIKVTGITEISTEEILSVDYEFDNSNNCKLVKQVLSIMEHTLEQCKGREFEFPLLYLTKNIFYLLDICADLGRDASFVSKELLQLSNNLKPHFHFSDYSFLKLQFPYLDASFMENLDDEDES